MQNSDIIRKRLNDLKRLSQDLKQSTEVKRDMDINLIKAIFDITKVTPDKSISYSSSQQRLNLNNQSELMQKSQRLSRAKSNQVIQKFPIFTKNIGNLIRKEKLREEFDTILPISNRQQDLEPLFPENNEFMPTNMSELETKRPKIQLGKLHEDQILHLREENFRLENQVKQLKAIIQNYQSLEIAKDKDKDKKANIDSQKQQNGEESPYFRLKQEVDSFITKLAIKEEDYQRIEYSPHPLKLSLECLQFTKKQKKVNDEKTKTNKTKLKLKDLKNVHYIGEEAILFVFQEQEAQNSELTRVFLHFSDWNALHRWDLGIYCNSNIVSNLGASKIFNKNSTKPKIIQEQILVSNPRQNQEIGKLDDRSILMKYLDNKQKYIESQKILREALLSKIVQHIPLPKIIQPNLTIIQSTNLKEQKQGMMPSEQIITISQSNYTKQQQPTQIIKQLKVQKEQVAINQPIKISPTLQQFQAIQKQKMIQKQKEYVNYALSYLKGGIQVIKYAKSALKPHEKRLFLSSDCSKLCWQGKESKQIKSINMTQIQVIKLGEVGEGVRAHLEEKKIKNIDSYLLIKTASKDRKFVQFSSKIGKQMKVFEQSLTTIIKQIRRGNIVINNGK